MRAVRSSDGDAYLVTGEAGDTTHVLDPSTGVETQVSASDLSPITDVPPLVVAANALPVNDDNPLASVADPRARGLVVHLAATGPQDVHSLLDIDALCESDLHGAVGELRAAGLVTETTVGGRRGYAVTDAGRTALAEARD